MPKVEVNNINLNYKVEGNGYPIIFIHGLADKIEYWKPLTDDLSNDYMTICFDLRGHGQTDMGDKTTSIDLYAEDLYALLKHLNIKEAVFVGLSLGGCIAMNFAIKYPEICSKLVIMSSFSEVNSETMKIFDNLENSLTHGYVDFCHEIMPYTLPEEIIEENKNIIEETIKVDAKTVNLQGLLNAIEACKNVSITDELGKITAPTLVITGEDDDFTNITTQQIICDNIKNSKQIILKNTKHNLLFGKNIAQIIKFIRNI